MIKENKPSVKKSKTKRKTKPGAGQLDKRGNPGKKKVVMEKYEEEGEKTMDRGRTKIFLPLRTIKRD